MATDGSGDLRKNQGARKNHRVNIRVMDIGDVAAVYHLGERLFTSEAFPILYRTWDTYEVTHSYEIDPELCLVAENPEGGIVGFALGTTFEKARSPWIYGYLSWLGVAPEYQGSRVAERLLREFEKRVKEEGARILLVDTEADNERALRFFEGHGFGQPKSHIWLSKSLTKGRRTSKQTKKGVERRPHPAKKAPRSQTVPTPGPAIGEDGNSDSDG